MADIVSKAKRSEMMSGIHGEDTDPELRVRSHFHRAGLRFRLHVKGLPGRPDVVLPRWKTIVFVHGCYWHHHRGCRFAYTPKTNRSFWRAKFAENVERDRREARQLRKKGWRVLTVWECQTSPARLDRMVQRITG